MYFEELLETRKKVREGKKEMKRKEGKSWFFLSIGFGKEGQGKGKGKKSGREEKIEKKREEKREKFG